MESRYHYYDDDGLKQGVFSGGQIRYLAEMGVITPETLIENEGGQTIPAGKLKGLKFAKRVQWGSRKQRTHPLTLSRLISVIQPRIVPLSLLTLIFIVISLLGAWWVFLLGWLISGCIFAMLIVFLIVMEAAGKYTWSLSALINYLLSDSEYK